MKRNSGRNGGRKPSIGPVLARDGTMIAPTVKDAASRLGLSHQRIYQMIVERRADGTIVLKR